MQVMILLYNRNKFIMVSLMTKEVFWAFLISGSAALLHCLWGFWAESLK